MDARAGYRLLLVDDDTVDRLAVRRALSAAGVRADVHEASDAPSALAAIRAGSFDCVFLDYQLPGGDGLRVLTEARAAGVRTPMVVLTGHGDQETAVELMKAGAADYVAKSNLSPERLAAALRHAVRVHAAEEVARRAEMAMRQSEARYRTLVEATAVSVWTTAPDGTMTDAQPGWNAFTGQPPAAYAGWGWMDAVHPDDRERTVATWREALRTRGMYEIEHRLCRADGRWRWMLARAAPVLEDDGTVREWMGVHTDITDRRRAEEEREAAIASRSRFYAAMSHELRTPVNAVLGYNDLLLAEIYGPLNPKQHEGVERGQRAARHLLHLVNDVLDLSKLEAGKVELVLEPVSVTALINDLFATVSPLADEHDTELRLCASPDDGDDVIVTDPRRVQQILLNLVSNALKFGGERPVEVSCASLDGHVAVEVRDHGVGIAREDLERVFEEFTQLPSSASGGTGLGLPISKRLAEMLGGTLEAESELGIGSVFRLVLPRHAPEQDSE